MDQSRIDIAHQPQTATDFGISYFLGIQFPPAIADSLYDTMMTVAREVGDGFYVQPPESLHISVLDFVDSVVDPTKFGYKSKAEVWAKIGRQCEAAVAKAVTRMQPFDITFGELIVTDSAVILKGEDSSAVQKLRDDIMQDIASIRLPGAKNPPTIVHSSLARYTKVMPLEPVRRVVAAQSVAFTLHVDTVVVYNQRKMNMLESSVLQEYHCGNGV